MLFAFNDSPIPLIQLRFAESKQRYAETEGLSPVFVLSDLSVPSRTFEKIVSRGEK